MTEREQLEQAIAALEGQRALLGDAVVDAGIAPIRARLAALSAPDSTPPQQRKPATEPGDSGYGNGGERLTAQRATAPRLLITGGSGYLGRHLVRLLMREPDRWPGTFAYTFHSADPHALPSGARLDVRDAAAVARLVASFRPDAVIHTVGSNRPADMAAVITEGTAAVVEALRARAPAARLVHVSTDSVFDGANAPYDERAEARPINDYGRAKLEAERGVLAGAAGAAIVRTSLIYSLDEMDNGTAWMVEALRAGQPVVLFSNQRRNPVWADALAAALLELAAPGHPHRGLLHVAGSQVMTRAEFGLRMLDAWGIHERQTLTVADDAGGRWPLDCEMDLSLARRVLRTPMPGVDEVLGRMGRG